MGKNETRHFQHVSTIKIKILAKFHVEKMFFDNIRGYLLILLFYKAPTRVSENLLQKKVTKFGVVVIYV